MEREGGGVSAELLLEGIKDWAHNIMSESILGLVAAKKAGAPCGLMHPAGGSPTVGPCFDNPHNIMFSEGAEEGELGMKEGDSRSAKADKWEVLHPTISPSSVCNTHGHAHTATHLFCGLLSHYCAGSLSTREVLSTRENSHRLRGGPT